MLTRKRSQSHTRYASLTRHSSHMISQGFAVPSQRAAQFVKKLLVAGASSPAQIDLCCTLRYSGLSENYLFEAQPEMCVLPGLHYLQETLPLLDLGSIDHSKRPDIWILACLARECADVRNAWLDVIMLGFQGSEQASLLDVKVLVKYMVSSESSLRIECLDCLASGGSAGMLAPLLAEGVDIDMRSGEYLKLAITNCNFDAAWAILEQGYPVSEDVLRFFFSSVTTGLTSRHFSRRLQLAFARGESFVRFFDRLMKDVDLQEYHAPPTDWMESMCDDDDGYDKAEREFEDHTLTKVVLFMMSIILPGSVHNVRHRYLVAIENSRNYPEWPMRTGVSIVEILLKAGILRDRHLCPRIPPYDRSGKWFGNWWRGSPITTALYYCNETQIEIIKLFIKYGHDLEDETEDGTTAFLLAIEYRSHLFAKILIEGGSDLQRKNSKGIVPWKALLRRWWEDMYAAERAEEISLETGEFSEEAAHWERLVRDFYVQRGLDCDTELEKEFKHSEGMPFV